LTKSKVFIFWTGVVANVERVAVSCVRKEVYDLS
jgi:hypothetical protein